MWVKNTWQSKLSICEWVCMDRRVFHSTSACSHKSFCQRFLTLLNAKRYEVTPICCRREKLIALEVLLMYGFYCVSSGIKHYRTDFDLFALGPIRQMVVCNFLCGTFVITCSVKTNIQKLTNQPLRPPNKQQQKHRKPKSKIN